MDDFLYNNIIEIPKRNLEKNKDTLILICGDPGNGKSTIASQIGYVLDNTIYNRDCVETTPDGYLKKTLEMYKSSDSKGRVVMNDESRDTGGTNVLKKGVARYWDAIFENRQANLYQILIQSDFFKTPKDIVFHRALFLIYVMEEEDWSNGVFLFFSKKNLIKLWLDGKHAYKLYPHGENFKGRFVSFWAGNPEYLIKKKDSFIDKYTKIEKNKDNELEKRIILSTQINEKIKIDLLNCSRATYYNKKKRLSIASN